MTTRQWGYERAECTGDHALNLFLDDLEHLVDHYAAVNGQQPETRVFQAQAAANKLLQAYQKNARNTDAFTHQFIEIKSIVDAQDQLQLVPIFSSGLKQHLLRLLKKSNARTQH
ncbi:hypothetical protein LKR43_14150 [Pusillimonas sp. MFBS29]|uniref:hypothetical protein n=1 Tax=Pusillimonas sp. MFBS29 TaxID=2886690 RepID=UPI001D0F8D79|nr:hypothetical protein [Pusillimonas sp. MFBS29]MCC2597477.1 hypothetical protein [Pusillimonas sp. MFBS29]